MKLLTIIGARPQFIKAATISREILLHHSAIKEILVHTGQHYDKNMSDIFFSELDIPKPNYHLGVGGGSHGQNTGRMLEKIDALIHRESPDWVLVYGDTDSTLAGALAAAKLHVPVAHVEAGLRSFNRAMPEEINRVLTDHLADMLFTPSANAAQNLISEGISKEKIHVTGDIMLDAALYYKARSYKPAWFDGLGHKKFFLCTIHRAENTNSATRMRSILSGLAYSPRPIIFPVHPRTRKSLEILSDQIPNTVHLVDPVGYLEMVWLEANCLAIVTDSGGVQKEAFFHGKPCITLRDETEWTELVKLKANLLVGSDVDRIKEALTNIDLRIEHNNIYGSGDSAAKIVSILNKGFK